MNNFWTGFSGFFNSEILGFVTAGVLFCGALIIGVLCSADVATAIQKGYRPRWWRK